MWDIEQIITVAIGVIMIVSFISLVVYSMKGFNLMVGFFGMATLWLVLVLIGNQFTGVMGDTTVIDALTYVYQTGPAGYASSILVNVFFGSFFGRILMDTGIAATLIRKVVELGGDRPSLTMILLCIATALCFTSMTGIGPVISIAVIVLPILLALGIPAPIALFAFMGSIMTGMLANVTNFAQYQGIMAGLDERFTAEYNYSQYFAFGATGMAIALVIVLIVCCVLLKRHSASHAWAASTPSQSEPVDAPWFSWISVILPVILVAAFKCPIILAFCVSGVYALLTCGKFKGGFVNICSMLARLFSDGSVDVAPMVGFLLTLSMFNNAATYAAPYFQSIIGGIFPTSPLPLAILFAVIMPLGFFRGPTNLVGCGTAVAAVVLNLGVTWAVPFLYPIFATATIVPQHIDLTQSWVVWGLGYTKVGSKDFAKMAMPTGWVIGAILCMVAYVMYGAAGVVA